MRHCAEQWKEVDCSSFPLDCLFCLVFRKTLFTLYLHIICCCFRLHMLHETKHQLCCSLDNSTILQKIPERHYPRRGSATGGVQRWESRGVVCRWRFLWSRSLLSRKRCWCDENTLMHFKALYKHLKRKDKCFKRSSRTLLGNRIFEAKYKAHLWKQTFACRLQWRSLPNIFSGAKNFDFSRATVLCLGYRLSKHKMTRYANIFGRHGLWSPPGYAYGRLLEFQVHIMNYLC